jgi:RHS repeat-associated protein
MEKDDAVKGSGNSYDFGARIYDSRIGKTLTEDPAKKLYPGWSPYAFAMNSPLQAIDPDGQVVIFINGLWGPIGDIKEPNENYWTGRYDNKSWVEGLQVHWSDYSDPLFFDGSVGGQGNLDNNISPAYRWVAGQKSGYSNAKSIIENLSDGETIKFVTNSMGAAFQRGFSEGLQLYINEQQLGNLQEQQGVMNNIKAIENQLKEFDKSPLIMMDITPEELQKSLEIQKERLTKLEDEYQKLESVTIEIVVDIEPFQQTSRDQNAENHSFILSDKSSYNYFEHKFFLVGGIQPVVGATDASTKPDGSSVTDGHHSSFTNPSDLPKPE